MVFRGVCRLVLLGQVFGQAAGVQHGIRDVQQRPVGAVAGPGQKLPGLHGAEVVQGHQDAGRRGDPLGVWS